jgi:hypothetical protein
MGYDQKHFFHGRWQRKFGPHTQWVGFRDVKANSALFVYFEYLRLLRLDEAMILR